jgi:hypothetical protein
MLNFSKIFILIMIYEAVKQKFWPLFPAGDGQSFCHRQGVLVQRPTCDDTFDAHGFQLGECFYVEDIGNAP